MSKHTPGPWQVKHRDSTAVVDCDGETRGCSYIADCSGGTVGYGLAERRANARLIAAAPDLLAALSFILAFYEPGQTCLDTNAWKQAEASARRAVAKATGEAV